MISRLQNSWLKNKLAKEDIDSKQKALLAAMAKKAKELISDDKFKSYKEMYEDYYAQEMENILMLPEMDPVKYAFMVKEIVATLKAYRLLISSIEQDAQMPMEVEK